MAERNEAVLRRIRGETIPDIAGKLHVSKASVSLWTRDIAIPKRTLRVMRERQMKNRLLAHEARRRGTKDKLAAAEREARQRFMQKNIDRREALLLCSLLYWCEGSKSKNDTEFTFTNAEPLMIRGFLSLFRTAFPDADPKKLRVNMHLHEYHDERRQRKFWSRVTGIPEAQFTKTFWKAHTGKTTRKGYPGCVHVRYYDVRVSRTVSATARAFLGFVSDDTMPHTGL